MRTKTTQTPRNPLSRSTTSFHPPLPPATRHFFSFFFSFSPKKSKPPDLSREGFSLRTPTPQARYPKRSPRLIFPWARGAHPLFFCTLSNLFVFSRSRRAGWDCDRATRQPAEPGVVDFFASPLPGFFPTVRVPHPLMTMFVWQRLGGRTPAFLAFRIQISLQFFPCEFSPPHFVRSGPPLLKIPSTG